MIDFHPVKELLSKIETIEIIKKIEYFRKLDFKKISDTDLFNEINKVISVNVDGVEKAILLPRFITYPPKTRFYRVRSVQPKDHYIPLKAMTFESDAWNPPPQLVKTRGRLNDVNESLLYTSPIDPHVAVEEMKIRDGERFCLIVYESISDIKASMIGFWEDFPELNSEENLKMRLFSNFLNDEFTRDVGVGTEFLYRTSERIAKFYFDLPPRVAQDAWGYPSVAIKPSVNVCFRPDIAKELLEIKGVQICTVKRENSGYHFQCQAIAVGFDEDKKFKYYTVQHPICKEIFPEIQLSNNVREQEETIQK